MPRENASQKLLEQFNSGSRRALAKVISAVENESAIVPELLESIYENTGRAYRIGITGPPGAGKSTLVDRLTALLRQNDKTVGIVAVDPSSPFTGGALLGDRVRMTEVATDPGVFIRSMATRGSLGGLSQKAQEVGDVFDAFGKDCVIFETVGVGQSELDIIETADTVIVILVPESGDAVQAMKAGLMEIADIFVMNKSDREGAKQAVHELEAILHLRPPAEWYPAVIATVASTGKGISEVKNKINQHHANLEQAGRLELKRKNRMEKMIRALVSRKLKQEFWNDERQAMLAEYLDNFKGRNFSPYRIVDELVGKFER